MKDNGNAIVGILYDEFNQYSFKGFQIHLMEKDVVKIFNRHKDPILDSIDCMKFIVENSEYNYIGASSIDHFVMDNDKFDFAYGYQLTKRMDNKNENIN